MGQRNDSSRPLLEAPIPRKLSEAAVKRWTIVWTVVISAALLTLLVAGDPFARPMWGLLALLSVAASAMLSISVSRVDTTLVISVAPAMLLLALNSTDPLTALFLWGLGNYIGLIVQLRNNGDAAEEASYRLGAGLVMTAVWQQIAPDHTSFWWICAFACVAIYAVTLFLISSVRLLVVTHLGFITGLRGVLGKRALLAWAVISLVTVASLGLQRLFSGMDGKSYSMTLSGGAVMVILGTLVYMIGTRREYDFLAARLEGALDAALELPWSNDVSIEEHALQFARTAMPQHTIELRKDPGRNVNEIFTRMGDTHLVARRGNFQSPFLPQDQHVLDGVAHIAETMADARSERERLTRAALTDELTGLPNYRHLRKRLVGLAESATAPFAVVYIDVDNFKDVNDLYGHEVGNYVLRTLADRMDTCLSAPDLVARVGGDEFVLLLSGLSGEEDAHRRIGELITEVSAPVLVGSLVATVTLSYGLVLAEGGRADATALIAASDGHMYQGRGSDLVGAEEVEALSSRGATEKRDLVRAVEAAVRENKISLAYQPIIDCENNRIVALEALFRPRDPELAEVPIELIIHEARRLGMLTTLSTHVVDTAVADMRRFGEVAPELIDVYVNIDLQQMSEPAFIEEVSRVNGQHGVRITLELSETSLKHVREDTYDELQRLRETIGIRIALDDFGRDAATLRAMVEYPLDVLKIDKSLARGMEACKRQELMRYMLLLTRQLDLLLIVEGVEDREVYEQLVAVDVRYMQGYHFSVPLTADLLLDRLKTHGLRGCLDEPEGSAWER